MRTTGLLLLLLAGLMSIGDAGLTNYVPTRNS